MNKDGIAGLHTLLDEFASAEPAPGGGSAAALCGALAASLTAMVCRLTVGRPKYQAAEERMLHILGRVSAARMELQSLIELDADGYLKVFAARALPKTTEEEKLLRLEAVREAVKNATEIPLRTARLCLEILRFAAEAVEIGNPNAMTDAGSAVAAAHAGARAAVYNVRVNLPGLGDDSWVTDTARMADDFLQEAENAAAAVAAKLDKMQGREG